MGWGICAIVVLSVAVPLLRVPTAPEQGWGLSWGVGMEQLRAALAEAAVTKASLAPAPILDGEMGPMCLAWGFQGSGKAFPVQHGPGGSPQPTPNPAAAAQHCRDPQSEGLSPK